MKALLIILLLPSFLQAQRSMQEYYQLNSLKFAVNFSFYEEQLVALKTRKLNHIKEVQISTKGKRGKEYLQTLTFNQKGMISSSITSKTTIERTYQDDTLLTNVIKMSKGNITNENMTYVNGEISTKELIRNGKLKSQTKVFYNSFNEIEKMQLMKRNKMYEILYFYEGDTLKKTIFQVNGKITKTWDYSCKPEGAVVSSKKEAVSSSCTFQEESADGSYVIFTRILKDGKPYLNKQTFSKDSVFLEFKSFLKDSILVREEKREGNTTTFASYKENGKRLFKQVIRTDDAGNIIGREWYGKKDNNGSKTEYEQNTDGTIKTRKVYSKGKLLSTSNYQYQYFKL